MLCLAFSLALASAASATANVTNVTVYRITPRNYSGLVNMDSGDAAGDAFFGLYELSFPVLCADARFQQMIGCSNEPILSIPGFNVYAKVLVTADARFGQYAECNPNHETGIFSCAHFGGRDCWYKDPAMKQKFAGVCDPGVCKCDAVESLALGDKDMARHGMGPPTNGSLPKGCPASAGLNPMAGHKAVGFPYSKSTVDEGACCSACAASNASCMAYTYERSSRLCSLYKRIFGVLPAEGFDAAYSWGHSMPPLMTSIGKLSQILGGHWYSTQAAGQCKPGQTVGVDCWWEETTLLRNVNASCVNDRMVDMVRQARPSCFKGCGEAGAKNLTSPCAINCIFETLVGNASATPPVPPMTKESLVATFEAAFADDDSACPEVPPCPPPCKPPAGGVTLRPNRAFGRW